MSKTKERAEKICLNCNAELIGRYCHICGQENVEPKDSAWGLVTHFFSDITHFDGKFFSTMKWLIRKPGFLSSEYIRGRRVRYLNPIRMYVFSSAFFFLVFFSVFSIKRLNTGVNGAADLTPKGVDMLKKEAYKDAKNKKDSMKIDSSFSYIKGFVKPDPKDTSLKKVIDTIGGLKFSGSSFETKYKSIHEYDSIQAALPVGKKDSWLPGMAIHKILEVKERYGNNMKQFIVDLLNKFMHTFPALLFVSLPLYALYLKLLYIRRKRFYYVDHGIFLIYLYIFTFIFMLVYFAVDKIRTSYNLDFLKFIEFILILYGIYYTYRSMRNFYGQGRFKTFVKFALLNMIAFFTMLILFTIFFGISLFQL